MNSHTIRTLYGYHFTLNRRLWQYGVVPLTDEEFLRPLDYSIGSIRNQIVHIMSVDQRWFARLMQRDVPPRSHEDEFTDRASVRATWTRIEEDMQIYVDNVTDKDLMEMISYETSRRGLMSDQRWRILAHVVNHGTDHRAQTRAMLYVLGKPIELEQDMMLLWWEE